MPLIKSQSKKAFEHNLKAELQAGKPQDQALAIAYSTKRDAAKRHYANGGQIPPDKVATLQEKHPKSIVEAILRTQRQPEPPHEDLFETLGDDYIDWGDTLPEHKEPIRLSLAKKLLKSRKE